MKSSQEKLLASPVSRQIVKGLALVIATTGRQQILSQTIRGLAARTYVPEWMIVVGAAETDLADPACFGAIQFQQIVSPVRRLPSQRNLGVQALEKLPCNYVAFLDDDCEIQDEYFKEVVDVFDASPELAAFSGCILANGNIESPEARMILDAHQIPAGMPAYGLLAKEWPGLYGCSMNFRRDLLEKEPFDERLPRYAIGEDTEIGFRMRRHGVVGGSARCRVVHLAARTGRVSEVGVGYAQIVNFLYFASKGIGYPFFSTLIERLILVPTKNFLKMVFPFGTERGVIDRAGRFKGNLLALRDLCMLRLAPERLEVILARIR